MQGLFSKLRGNRNEDTNASSPVVPTSSSAGSTTPGRSPDILPPTPPDTLGIHVLYQPPAEIPIKLDIVAIHGLGGDSFATWTHKNKILWLRDLLPHDLKNASIPARIMTYGYDVGMFGKAKTSRTFDFAGTMLSRIQDKRMGEAKHRPLIFLAHSLGGIVLKQALIIAWLRSTLWADLLRSVRHIIFFGTPHHGAVSVVNLVRGVGSSALGATSDSALRDLELWSGPSMQVNASFIDDVASNFTWTTVVENEDLVLGNRIVHQGSAVLLQRQEKVIILDADHNGICKFPSAQDNRYRTIFDRIVAEVSLLNDPEALRNHEARVEALLQSTEKLIEEGNSWLSSNPRTLDHLSYAGECFSKVLLNARESRDPKIFLRAYRGLHHVELEKTHLYGQGLEYESHLELARNYCDKATEVVRTARDALGRGDLSKVQFDRACITKREGRLKQRRSKASSSSLTEIWNQAFKDFNRIANDLGKIGKLPVDLLNLRARALYEAGRMAAEIQSASSPSQEMSLIPEEKSAKNHRLSGETLLLVPDPSGFYWEAIRILERFRQETDLTEVQTSDLDGLKHVEEQIRSGIPRDTSKAS